jgi:hypothetical protein
MAVPQFWGVDSFNALDHTMDGTGKKTLFEFVTDSLGRPPDFWGRYLIKSGGNSTQPPLSASELSHIAAQNKKWSSACKVLFVFQVNRSQAHMGTEQMGQTDAVNAKNIATSLNVPGGKNIAIYADMEDYMPDARWLKGWIDRMKAAPSFVPGIYSLTADLRNLFSPFPPKQGTKNKLDPFFTGANPSNPFLWWITNPNYQGPTPPTFAAKDKPFGLTAFDLLDALNVNSKQGPRASMDPRLQNLLVLWQYSISKDVAVPDLKVVSWGTGPPVPTTGNNVIHLGTDDKGLLHVRSFDGGGNLVVDTDETSLPKTKAAAISTLKQELPGLLTPHRPTRDEKDKIIAELASILDRPPTNCTFVRPPASRQDAKGNPIGQIDLNVSSQAAYDAMYLPV